jgi:RNA polymerase sigma-70 factor (ECF subfamily)
MPYGQEGAALAAMTELTDREAVVRCLAGGEEGHDAFRVLFERHAPEVYRFERRLLDDHQAAEDAVQETFVRFHRALASYDMERPLRPFLFSVARNVAIDVVRARQKRPKPVTLVAEPAAAGGVPEAATTHERETLVGEALAALAPEHRSILVLRHMHELKLDDIAASLSCTVRTAHNRIRAASVLLERELKRRGLFAREVTS